MSWLDSGNRRRAGPEATERVSAGCYGAIVAASTLAGSAALPAASLILLVVATNSVYFGTHVLAYAIGDPNLEREPFHRLVVHHARVAGPMITAVFVPLLVVLTLEFFGTDHERATNIGVITAAGLLVAVALPGAYVHGMRGWRLAVLGFAVIAMTTLLVLAKVWLTH
jgi:hypothetical protein